jgi:hypothetical protein
MTKFLLIGGAVILVLYALIDALQTDKALVRTLPKWLWIVVILVLPVLGAVWWLVSGRAPRSSYADPASGARPSMFGRKRGPVAPDDDPRFLRQLDDEAWQKKMRERREGRPSGEHPGDAPTAS